MKKIIVLGNGQLGNYIYNNLLKEVSCPENYSIEVIDYPDFDIIDEDHVKKVVDNYDIIINAAAYTNVDKAESDSLNCMMINSSGPISIAGKVLLYPDKKFVHISSEVVYGSNDPEYKKLNELSPKNPVNVYSKSKKSADDYIEGLMKLTHNLLILRSGWLFGPNNNHNFIEKIRKLLSEKQEINVVNDQIGTLTYVDLILKSIISFIEGELPSDVYNIGNEGYPSRYEVACFVKQCMGYNCKINECDSSGFKRVAEVAKNSCLDCSKIDSYIKFKRPNWKIDVEKVLLK